MYLSVQELLCGSKSILLACLASMIFAVNRPEPERISDLEDEMISLRHLLLEFLKEHVIMNSSLRVGCQSESFLCSD